MNKKKFMKLQLWQEPTNADELVIRKYRHRPEVLVNVLATVIVCVFMVFLYPVFKDIFSLVPEIKYIYPAAVVFLGYMMISNVVVEVISEIDFRRGNVEVTYAEVMDLDKEVTHHGRIRWVGFETVIGDWRGNETTVLLECGNEEFDDYLEDKSDISEVLLCRYVHSGEVRVYPKMI